MNQVPTVVEGGGGRGRVRGRGDADAFATLWMQFTRGKRYCGGRYEVIREQQCPHDRIPATMAVIIITFINGLQRGNVSM